MMGFLNDWLLTILLLVPAIGGATVPLVRSPRAARFTAIGFALATAFLSLLILIPFHRQQGTAYYYGPAGTVQLLREAELLPSLHAGYRVAVDGLSIPFVALTTIVAAACCAALPADAERAKTQFTMLLWLEAAALGVFVSFDLLLLWLFLTLSIIPCCGLVWLSSGDRRARAALTFLWPMLAGLACLLIMAMGEGVVSTRCVEGATLDLVRLAACHVSGPQRTLFILALIGFLVRLPVFPFHAWLSVVLTESSPSVAAAVGVLVPLTGGYGLFRVVLPLFAPASVSLWWVLAAIGLFGLVYHSLAGIGQPGFRRAAVHVTCAMFGFVLIGVAVRTPAGLNGGVFTLLSASLIVALIALPGEAGRGKAPHEPSRAGLARAGSAGAGGLAAAGLALLVVPGLFGEAIVLFGTFEAVQHGSVLIDGHAATTGSLLVVASAQCVGIVLLGAAGVHAMRLFAHPRELASLLQGPDTLAPNAGASVAVAILVALVGALSTPFCFAFTRHALDVLAARAPHL